MSTFLRPNGTEANRVAPNDTAYLCLMTVTHGYRKGWNRLYSLPRSLPIEDLDNMLVQLFLPPGVDWDIQSVKLLVPVILHGLECCSVTEILPLYYNNEVTLESLDALSGPSDLHIVIDVHITGGKVTNMATWDLTFTAEITAAEKGKIACLSGVNLDEENANSTIFSKADDIGLLKKSLNDDLISSYITS
ncbi:hypothetical protein MMC17_005783 [Xylographa soralifera]|nr:hypothetical protein [Xylographa soralifera]